MMRLPAGEIGARAEVIATDLPAEYQAAVVDGESVIGGGSAPGATLKTRALAVSLHGASADELAARLRSSDPPIIARVEEGRVLLDLRTVFPEQDAALLHALQAIAEM